MKSGKSNIKKIYVTNYWHARNNYGANLTAYALQSILQSLGYSTNLINNSFKFEEIKNKGRFGFDFQKKYLTTTSFIGENLEQLNNDGCIFITGSDQVFRPIYATKKLNEYLLDFVKIDNKKIAFSASFGVDKAQFLKENTDESIQHMKNSLKSFDFISVREKSGVEICKDLFILDAEWIIDPVFIIEKSKYNELIKNSTIDYKNKIVAYVLDTSKEYKKVYKYISKKYDKKIVETANSNISVENWLASIKDCDLFITDSFHGMCFAIIFNKPFICIANKDRGHTRFCSICEMLGVENQCIDSILEVNKKDCIFKIDYAKVNQRIKEEKQKGLDFLNKVLDAQTQVTEQKIDTRMKYLENRILQLEKQNNLVCQFKKSFWKQWLVIYHCYLPMPIKKMISSFWHKIKK